MLRAVPAVACLVALAFVSSAWPPAAAADPLPPVAGVERQPLAAQAKRIAQALELAGSPLTPGLQKALDAATELKDDAEAVAAIQKVLDPLCLVGVEINPESRVKVAVGPARPALLQQGWRVFLVKVQNDAGVTAEMRVSSPNAAPLHKRSTSSPAPPVSIKPADVGDRWLDLAANVRQPLAKALSGLKLEYRLLELYTRDVGKREGKLAFDVGQGTQDLGFRNEVNILFQCEPSVEVALEVIDHDGTPVMGQFEFRDRQGRIYPAMSRRLAPDLFFHPQIYRQNGEIVILPPGEYDVIYTRGPEYEIQKRKITVPAGTASHKETFRLKRWIHLASRGWYSGDHHVHAAGCAHYESPAEGIQPQDMMRHILGEDLNVGCVLSWGPCWYYQKQFFDGAVSKLSTDRYLMRYDVEVSGFPSSHAGHLCLLRLKEDDYPGTTKIEEWPSWDLPVLKWGKEQGGVVGFSHSGWGLKVNGDKLPTYEMPPFDGIGANEYIVDVAHDVCHFISAVDTPIIWELNIWYHTLNCGYGCVLSGETDFPCIYGERVGLGRGYVKLDPSKKLTYDDWVLGIRDGRSYVGDGLSHLIDFQVNGLGVGEPGDKGRPSVLALEAGRPARVRVQAAALLAEKPTAETEAIRKRPLDQKPYWHVERARLGDSRKTTVELIVNGQPVEKKEIVGDGTVSEVQFEFQPKASCWAALRIFPSSHTNPVFIEVDGKPIRASKKSAEWCAKAVDVCWNAKSGRIRDSEKQAAKAAFEFAKAAYVKIAGEATGE